MPSSKELLSAPPVATGSGTFLGVPQGYKAQTPTGPGKAPIYAEGAQYDPNGLAIEIRAQMQAQLDAAGLYDKGDVIRVGVWDDTTVSAYTKLLKYANQGGKTVTEALKEMGTLSAAERAERGLGPQGKGGVGGRATQPLVTALSSPTDLRSIADRTARKTLGRALTEQEKQRFVTAYQALEAGAQKTADSLEATGGTVTKAPSAEEFAVEQVEAMDPVAAEAARQVNVFKTISGHLAGLKG